MSYRARIQATGKTFKVQADESLLEAALLQDIALPYGCQSGGCGACRARLLEGEIAYPYEPPALSEADKRAGYILLCQAQPRSDVCIAVEELPEDHAIPVRNLPVRVEQREQLCHDVMRLVLKLPKGEAFEFLAGQYVDILLRDGRRRSFSIASPPEQKSYIDLHLRHVPGGDFTDYVFRQMPERAILRIEGPLGGFYLREASSRPRLFMAGGTGIAPIKSMLEHMFTRGWQQPLRLFWGVRAQRDLYLHELLLQWQAQHAWLQYIPVLSEPAGDEAWNGATGFVHETVLGVVPDLAEYGVYMSGPPAMVQAAQAAFTARGLPPEQLHYDSFDYAFETWPQREQGGLR